MSTAGKVLTVIVTLSILFWISMFSVVTQLNKNWQERIRALTKDLEGLQKQAPELESKLSQALFDLTAEQNRMNDDLTVLRSRLSDVEKSDAESRETLDRAKLQLASVEAAVRSSQGTSEFRLGQRDDTQKKLAQERGRVERLKADVAKSMDELATLRSQFKSVLEENKAMLAKLRRLAPSGGRRVRSATFRN
jgi:chromosome segregation ATPase